MNRNQALFPGAAPAVLLVLVAGAAPAFGTSGTVVDGSGAPVAGADACLLSAGVPLLCAQTDSRGFFDLPASSAPAVRIRATGYLPLMIAAVDQEAPIVLNRAGSLRLHVVEEPGGAPVGGGRIQVVYANGHKIGPFPFNRGGLDLPTLEPGEVMCRVELDGYDQVGGMRAIRLEAGEPAAATLRVTRLSRDRPALEAR